MFIYKFIEGIEITTPPWQDCYVPHKFNGDPQRLIQAMEATSDRAMTERDFFSTAAKLDVDPNCNEIQKRIREVQYGIRFLK